jgi:hypothetical protein
VNRVKLGFFSLTSRSSREDDRPYLRWHQLDHMPEQYQLAGLVNGQRWGSTPACRSARIAETDGWTDVEHLVCYLMGEPVPETLEGFFDLGRTLAEMGRFSHRMPNYYKAGLALLETHAAPRALVSAEVVPFRPNRGVLLVVEEPDGHEGWNDYLQRNHREVVPELLGTQGVAGLWIFARSSALTHKTFTEGTERFTICYLDDEPAEVADRVAGILRKSWSGSPTRPLLAAPFESMMRWDWDRFAPVTRTPAQ